MSRDSRSRRSISKHRGAAMSSRLMPPKPGAIISTALHDLVGVLGGQADRPGVDVGEPLEERGLALHHRQRGTRADVAEPEDGRAVGDHRDRVALDRQLADVLGVVVDRHRHPADAGRVGHREVVAGAQRHLGGDLDLAAEVQQEGPVADLVDRHARRPRRRLATRSWECSESEAEHVTSTTRRSWRDSVDVDRGDHATVRGDRGRDRADHPVVGGGVQPHGDRVRRCGGGHASTFPVGRGYRQVTRRDPRLPSSHGHRVRRQRRGHRFELSHPATSDSAWSPTASPDGVDHAGAHRGRPRPRRRGARRDAGRGRARRRARARARGHAAVPLRRVLHPQAPGVRRPGGGRG